MLGPLFMASDSEVPREKFGNSNGFLVLLVGLTSTYHNDWLLKLQ